MPKCRDNRNRRKKRDKKHLLDLARKRLTNKILSLDGGKNPSYYAVCFYGAKSVVRGGRRYLSVQYAVRQRQTLGELYAQLAEMCKGVTVDLSGILKGPPQGDEVVTNNEGGVASQP